jgi:putative ABC transport system ATP-binding protein
VDKQQLPNSQNDDFVSLKSYYHHIGYLTQEPNVFDGTIYENLTYALPEGTVDDRIIHQVIESSQCQFIYDFPDGLETHIGEK